MSDQVTSITVGQTEHRFNEHGQRVDKSGVPMSVPRDKCAALDRRKTPARRQTTAEKREAGIGAGLYGLTPSQVVDCIRHLAASGCSATSAQRCARANGIQLANVIDLMTCEQVHRIQIAASFEIGAPRERYLQGVKTGLGGK